MPVDDHPFLLQGLATIVGDEPDMMIVAQASNGREAIQQGWTGAIPSGYSVTRDGAGTTISITLVLSVAEELF